MKQYLWTSILCLGVFAACQKNDKPEFTGFENPTHFPTATYPFNSNPVTEAGFETEDFELLEKMVESEKKKTPTTSKLAPTIRNFCILLAKYAHCIIDKKKDVGIRAIWTGLVLFFRLKRAYQAFSSA